MGVDPRHVKEYDTTTKATDSSGRTTWVTIFKIDSHHIDGLRRLSTSAASTVLSSIADPSFASNVGGVLGTTVTTSSANITLATRSPTMAPTALPTIAPSEGPTRSPTRSPTVLPTTSAPSVFPTADDTTKLSVSFELSGCSAAASDAQATVLKNLTAINLGVDPSNMKDFEVTSTLATRRLLRSKKDILTRERRLSSYTWQCSFSVSASLEDLGASSGATWASSVASTLASPAFTAAVASGVGEPSLKVDASSLAVDVIYRWDPSMPPTAPPTTPSLTSEPSPTPTTSEPTPMPVVSEYHGINSASTGAIVIVGIVALAAAVGYTIIGRRYDKKHPRKTHYDKDSSTVDVTGISKRAELMTCLATVDLVTSWSFVFIALQQKTFAIAVVSFTSNCLLLMLRIKFVNYVFEEVFEKLGDRCQLHEVHGSGSGYSRLYLMCCLVFECVTFVPWHPSKYLALSSSGFPSQEVLWLSTIVAFLQGVSSVSLQMYYIVCVSRQEVTLWNFVYEAQDGHFVVFSVVVSVAALLWSVPKKLRTLRKHRLLALRRGISPSDLISTTEIAHAPLSMEKSQDVMSIGMTSKPQLANEENKADDYGDGPDSDHAPSDHPLAWFLNAMRVAELGDGEQEGGYVADAPLGEYKIRDVEPNVDSAMDAEYKTDDAGDDGNAVETPSYIAEEYGESADHTTAASTDWERLPDVSGGAREESGSTNQDTREELDGAQSSLHSGAHEFQWFLEATNSPASISDDSENTQESVPGEFVVEHSLEHVVNALPQDSATSIEELQREANEVHQAALLQRIVGFGVLRVEVETERHDDVPTVHPVETSGSTSISDDGPVEPHYQPDDIDKTCTSAEPEQSMDTSLAGFEESQLEPRLESFPAVFADFKDAERIIESKSRRYARSLSPVASKSRPAVTQDGRYDHRYKYRAKRLTPTKRDAKAYVRRVQQAFKGEMGLYAQFLQVMTEIKEHNEMNVSIVTRIRVIFQGHPDLLQGFNVFLPEDKQVDFSGVVSSRKTLHSVEDDIDFPKQLTPQSMPKKADRRLRKGRGSGSGALKSTAVSPSSSAESPSLLSAAESSAAWIASIDSKFDAMLDTLQTTPVALRKGRGSDSGARKSTAVSSPHTKLPLAQGRFRGHRKLPLPSTPPPPRRSTSSPPTSHRRPPPAGWDPTVRGTVDQCSTELKYSKRRITDLSAIASPAKTSKK